MRSRHGVLGLSFTSPDLRPGPLGARQVGKTTLARAAFDTHRYLDLQDPRTAERFRHDARFELDTAADSGLILDEAQAVPSVFGALRGAVDAQRTRLGRFIVLGSAQPALVRGVSESLAGRAAVSSWIRSPLRRRRKDRMPRPGPRCGSRAWFPDALRGDSRSSWQSAPLYSAWYWPNGDRPEWAKRRTASVSFSQRQSASVSDESDESNAAAPGCAA